MDATADTKPYTPRWDPRTASLVLLAILAAGCVFTLLGPVLRPFLIAVFAYYITRSTVRYLAKVGIPEWFGYTVLLSVTVAAVVVVSSIVSNESQAFREAFPELQRKVIDFLGDALGTQGGVIRKFFQESSGEVLRYVFEAGLFTLEVLLMSFFYLLFLILGARRMHDRVQRAFPAEEGAKVQSISQQINDGMEEYLRVKTLVSLGLAATSSAVMYFFGLEQWLLWGVAFFLLNFITYFGSMAALVPPIALAFLDGRSTLMAGVFALVLVLVRLFWIDYAEIKMSGRRLNFDSALLLLWVAYWGWQWGVVGLILAFPMAASLKIILENITPTRRVAILLGDE